MGVTSAQRFTAAHPCPVCGGHQSMRPGRGLRCWGFLSADGEYAHCTREEYAGELAVGQDGTHAHRLSGDCRCGQRHDQRVPRLKGVAVPRRLLREKAYAIADGFEHVRYDYDDGSKTFQWRSNGVPGLGGLKVEDLSLYGCDGLASLAQGTTVVIVEGEKACDALNSRGVPAVATATGAKSLPARSVLDPLRPFDLVLWKDNDADGLHHMRGLAGRLAEGGTTCRWLDWPDAPEKGDAHDFFACGGTAEQLHRLVAAAREWHPAEDAPAWQPRLLIAPEERAMAARDTFVDRYIAYGKRRTDAPESFHEAVGLAALSVVVGRRAVLHLSTGDVYPSLWLMLLADSTIYRKSTSMDYGQELIELVDQELLTPNDFTPQRFVAILAEHDGRALLFKRDEFSGFYDGLNRLDYMAGLKECLCDVYDSRPFKREKMKPRAAAGQEESKQDEWRFNIREPFLSLLVGTTEERFFEVARPSDVNSGYLPRFAYVLPSGEARPSRPITELDVGTEQQRDSLAAELGEMAGRDIRLSATQEALARFNQYVADLEAEARGAPNRDLVAIVGSRISWMALRIAELLAVADTSQRIALPHLLRGMEVAEGWRQNAIRLLGGLAPSKFERRAQRLLQLVERVGAGGMSRRDAMRSLKANKREMDDLEVTLDQRGELRVEQRVTAGGASTWYTAALSPVSPLSLGAIPAD